jgi:putative transposase
VPKENIVLKLLVETSFEDANELDGQSRICNWLYNHLLEQAHQLKQEFIGGKQEAAKTLYSERGLRNLLPKIKEKHPFVKVVHSSSLKNAALRLSTSIRTFQKSKKKQKKTGWPKFRSWKKKWFSLLYDEPNKGFSIEGNTLVLSLGMGEDRKRRSLTLNLPDAKLLEGKTIRNLRLVYELGKYYAIFALQKELPSQKKISKVIAFDPNHKNFAYGVDVEGKAIEIASPSWIKTLDKRTDELKTKRDKCEKKSKKQPVLDSTGNPTGKEYYLPSRRWEKYNLALSKAYRKRREQTKTFMYTTAHKLFQKYDCVAVGDYTPQGGGITTQMRRAMNNRSLIGRFKGVLSWVAKKSGKTFQEFDEKGTTRSCRHCYYVIEEGLCPSIREWECPQCKAKHIRDENSAINGLEKVLSNLRKTGEFISPVSGSDLVVKKRWAWRVSTSGVIPIPRGRDCEKESFSQRQEIKSRA